MLTGIEQYHWERAGYFIRRSYLDEDTLDLLKSSEDSAINKAGEIAALLIADLLGEPGEIVETPGISDPHVWQRTQVGGSYSDGYAALARQPEGVVLRIALASDEMMQVLPGSHTMPLSNEEIGQLKENPAASLAGAVRIRLAPGDVLFYHTTLLNVAMPEAGKNVLEIRFRKQRG